MIALGDGATFRKSGAPSSPPTVERSPTDAQPVQTIPVTAPLAADDASADLTDPAPRNLAGGSELTKNLSKEFTEIIREAIQKGSPYRAEK